MNKQISDFVNLYFADVPYSEEIHAARERIIVALNEKYDELCNDEPDTAFERLVKQYGSLDDMAKLAGLADDEICSWKTDGETRDLRDVKRETRRQRFKIYALSLFAPIAVYVIYWLIYGFVYAPLWSLLMIPIMAAVGVSAFFTIRSFIRVEKNRSKKFNTSAFEYLRSMKDRYLKRRFNGIVIAAFCVLFFVATTVVSVFYSKTVEVTGVVMINFDLLLFAIFICIKNRLCFDLFYRRVPSDCKRLKKHYIGVLAFSASYCSVALVVLILIAETTNLWVNILLALGGLLAVFQVVYILAFRKKITRKNITLNRRRIAICTSVAVVFTCFTVMQRDTWYTQTYINSVAAVEHNSHAIDYDENSGVYTITASTDDFKILHLTDIHLGGSLASYRKDMKALKAVYAEIECTKPDFVIVTGDLCFPVGVMSLSLNNSAPVHQFAAFMRNIGIPWAFTYGNHDTEEMATISPTAMDDIFKSLSYKTSRNLLYPYTQPNISGRNNQIIELRRKDGSLNTALFLMDSNTYVSIGFSDYDYIHDDQVEWYADNVKSLNAREGRTVSSMAFFHIPLQEYRTAYKLYAKGSDEVKYFFGANDEKGHAVNCSDHPSKLFDTMVELNSTKAVFCGHDHYNNMSLEYKGIRLTYGMSIDYLAMPGIEDDVKQRGAELITIHSDGSWDLKQIPLKDIVK